MNYEVIDLIQIIESCFKVFLIQAAEKGIYLKTEWGYKYTPKRFLIRTDKVRL